MVLDIRDLRPQVEPVAETSLDQLLHGEQAQLHGLVLSAEDLEQLLTIAENSGDSRRLAAIDILSQHRSWLSSAAPAAPDRAVGAQGTRFPTSRGLGASTAPMRRSRPISNQQRACGRPRSSARRADQPPDPRADH